MSELKPCPFCGGEAVPRYTEKNTNGWTSNIIYRSKKGFVECKKCYARTKEHGKMCRAIEAWNRRANDEEEIKKGAQK